MKPSMAEGQVARAADDSFVDRVLSQKCHPPPAILNFIPAPHAPKIQCCDGEVSKTRFFSRTEMLLQSTLYNGGRGPNAEVSFAGCCPDWTPHA